MEPIVEYEAEVSRQGEKELAARELERFDHLAELHYVFSEEEIEQTFFWMERQ